MGTPPLWTRVIHFPTRNRRSLFITAFVLLFGVFIILFSVLFSLLGQHHHVVATSSPNSCSFPNCTGVIYPTITPESFTPFPVPTDTPINNVFVETTPSKPPSVEDSGKVVPDFGQAWKSAYSKAKAKIAGWTLEQKVNATTGIGWSNGRCVGNIPIIEDWGGLCLEVRILCLFMTDSVGTKMMIRIGFPTWRARSRFRFRFPYWR